MVLCVFHLFVFLSCGTVAESHLSGRHGTEYRGGGGWGVIFMFFPPNAKWYFPCVVTLISKIKRSLALQFDVAPVCFAVVGMLFSNKTQNSKWPLSVANRIFLKCEITTLPHFSGEKRRLITH